MFQTTQQSTPNAVERAGKGTVYSYTVVQDAPSDFAEQAPYILALVKLDDGAMVTAQLTDVDAEIAIGDRVEMVTRKLSTEGKQGTIVYGYKFRPMLTA
ncbi:MAG: Zn-ribbon domain-containing OB-fold protein [Chloroflexota bacterium]